jgi:hypothetical protein
MGLIYFDQNAERIGNLTFARMIWRILEGDG